MKSYLGLIPISAKVRKRQNRMTLMCIVISVFLVTSIFSVVDAYMKMEKTNLIKKHGNWHISLENVSEDVAVQISSRSDIGELVWCDEINEDAQEDYFAGDRRAVLYGSDEAWITDIRDCLEEGSFPKNDNEIMLSSNIKGDMEVGIGDSITLKTPVGDVDYTISGFGEHDADFNKLYDTVTVYMNRDAFFKLCELNGRDSSPLCYIRFNTDMGTGKRIEEIKSEYGLSDENIDENTAILAITGYSNNTYVQTIYPMVAIVFVLILAAGVLMISSSMNSNVSQRTQFFGMMRCIGMSRQQVIRFVRLEALNWCKTAIPIGILSGIFVSWILCAWLKFGIGGEFLELPLFTFSAIGIVFGAVVGILTVLIAAKSPAKRAAKVSPVAAVSGNMDNIKNARRTIGVGSFKVETVLGIGHAVSAKKNLILMTGSFALSIILFFAFSAGLDFAKALIPSTRTWQPDFAITTNDGTSTVDKDLVAEFERMPGVSHVYGIMASLNVPVVSGKGVSEVTLVSYEEYLFQCAKEYRVSGDLSKVSGETNHVLTIYSARNPLDVGDKIQINGTELEVVGSVSEGLFEDDVTLICTEETYERLMGESDYTLLSIQFSDNAEKDVSYIRSLMSDNYFLADYRDSNKETYTEFWAFRLIVYAFLTIIVLIAALNIINSTSMSVSARTKQYGAMRAVGMDGRQLTKMIVAEVFTYAFFGVFVGCVIGLPLNKLIFERFITAYFGEVWRVPVGMLIVILLVMFGATAVAVHAPAKRIRNMAVTETINEL